MTEKLVPPMLTLEEVRSVPVSHLPISSESWVAEEPVARLPSATALAAPPVQVALAALPFTSAWVM